MIEILTISSIAILYSMIRAFHDRHINTGPWKTWAFIEAVLVCLLTCIGVIVLFNLMWYQIFGLGLTFAFVFWIVFDCAIGLLREGDLLYIGETGWDKAARATFHYDRPFWGIQHPRGLKYLLFKAAWLGW